MDYITAYSHPQRPDKPGLNSKYVVSNTELNLSVSWLSAMCINSGTAALLIRRCTTEASAAQCVFKALTTPISQGLVAFVVIVYNSTHLLGGLAGGCAGEGAHSHNVLRLRVQTLLGTQIEAAQERL